MRSINLRFTYLLTYFFVMSSHAVSCHSCHLGFDQTGNSAIRSANSEHPTLEPVL